MTHKSDLEISRLQEEMHMHLLTREQDAFSCTCGMWAQVAPELLYH